MMQSNNTKSENLENHFTEILDKRHLLDGTKPRNRSESGLKRKRMKLLRAGLGSAGDVYS